MENSQDFWTKQGFVFRHFEERDMSIGYKDVVVGDVYVTFGRFRLPGNWKTVDDALNYMVKNPIAIQFFINEVYDMMKGGDVDRDLDDADNELDVECFNYD